MRLKHQYIVFSFDEENKNLVKYSFKYCVNTFDTEQEAVEAIVSEVEYFDNFFILKQISTNQY